MKYKRLIAQVRKFHERFAKSKAELELYPESVSPSYLNRDFMQKDDLEKVFRFLNVWGRCRLKCSKVEFLQAYNRISFILKPFQNSKLEHADFDRLFVTNEERMKAKKLIHLAFDELSNVRGFGPVPTSKVLHLVAPSLFVMWDNNICRVYKLRLNGYSYANEFLPRMKKELDEAIEDFMTTNGVERDAAINSIYDETRKIYGFSKSLAKSVDEFNWIEARMN